MTAAQAAELLALRESTLRDYARRGLVPSVKIGRHVRFIEADLVSYLDGLRSPGSRVERSVGAQGAFAWPSGRGD